MSLRIIVVLSVCCFLTFPAAAAGATQCLEDGLAAMGRATTRADSVSLAERFEREPPGGDRSCGEFLAGYLLGMTSSPAEDAWRQRQKGGELLENAMRSFSDEPRLYLAMGTLLHHRQSRTDALRTLDRAADRVERSAVPMTVRERALLWHQRGLVHQDMWRDWRDYGVLKTTAQGQWHCGLFEENVRDNFTSGTNDNRWLIGFSYTCADRFDENMGQYFEPRGGMHREEYVSLEEAFQRAMDVDPTFRAPAEALLAEYVYMRDWEKAVPLVAQVKARFPDDWRPLLWEGLVLHETRRDSLAVTAFGRAFLVMPDSEITRMEDFAMLLTPEQQQWLAEADSTVRRTAGNAYWNSLDPLYLTSANERKLEHYARVVGADLMFSAPTLHTRGAETYAGRLWIRYGHPVNSWELAMPGGRVVFWDYGPGPPLTFTRGQGFLSYRWTDQGRQYAEGLAQSAPQAYEPRSVYDSLVPLEYQVVRTLDYQARPQLLVYADIPASFARESEAAFLLMDAQYQPAAQWRGIRPREGIRAELNQVIPGAYSLTVEVWDKAQRLVGRVRDTVSTLAVNDSAFTVSDVMLARHVAVRRDVDEPESRRDLDLRPLYSERIRANESVSLYWEMYAFARQEGRLRVEVTLEVVDAAGRSILARVLGGVGIRGSRDPEARVRYESTRPLLNGRAIEWLEVGDLTPGEYIVRLRLRDRDSGREVTRERRLTVS